MGQTVKVSSIVLGCTLLLCNVASLIADIPLWALAVVDAIAGATFALVLFMWSRFTEQGQAERLMAQGLNAGEESGKRTLMSRALVYAVLAIISLLVGLQGFLNPELGGGRDSGISGILLAAALGFFALRTGSRSAPKALTSKSYSWPEAPVRVVVVFWANVFIESGGIVHPRTFI